MKQFKITIISRAGAAAAAAAGLVLLMGLLWFRLGSLTHGNAADIEVLNRLTAGSWQTILNNPLNAPYSVLQRLVILTGHHGITALRLISTAFAALAAVLFYFVARQWHSQRVALLSSWLFVTSSWFLHISRLGSPEILWLVSILALVVLLTPNRHGRQSPLALPSTLLILAIVLYVPGMVWLVLAGVFLQRKNIREAWQASQAGWLRFGSVLIMLGAAAPLVYGLVRSPGLIKQWLGLSAAGSLSAAHIAGNLLGVPKSLFLSGTFDPAHWLAGLPLLSSFEIVMLLLGLYFYASHIHAARTRLVMLMAAVSWLLIGVLGLNAITLIIPVVYLLAAAGIAYILHLWFHTFPRNPLARGFGIGAVMLVVLLTSVYQTRGYFVAWRYNSQTVQAFRTKL